MARVEDVETILNSSQVRYLARCASDPSTTEDIWKSTDADKTRQGKNLAARIFKQAQVESREKISWGGQVKRFEVIEHDLACSSKTPPHACAEAIERTKRYPIFTDGS